MHRVTQKDVAHLARVSQTSVSLAFRNDPSLPKETRRRILKAAAELGYRPDPMLSSLIAYRQANRPAHYRSTIGWVQTRSDSDKGSDHHHYHVGALERAELLGFRIEDFRLAPHPSGMSAERLNGVLAARNIRGVLIAPLPEAHGRLGLDWEHLSAVAFGYTLESPALNMVSNHHYRSMLLLVRKLLAVGYRRIGLAIPGLHDERIGCSYSAAFWVEQRNLPEADQVPPYVPDSLERPGFVKWYKKNQPDALITVGYGQVDRWLDDLGVQVPRDLGVAHISPRSGARSFSGVVENAHLIGAVAVDLLAGMLTRNEQGVPAFPQRVLIESRWVEGDSLRAPVAPAARRTVRKGR